MEFIKVESNFPDIVRHGYIWLCSRVKVNRGRNKETIIGYYGMNDFHRGHMYTAPGNK